MPYDRRLIEDSLPLEIISAQSAREKSIRHGHISTLHIWWARRPLAAMRAAIFASLIPAPKNEAERAYLHALIGDIVNWDAVKDGNNTRVEEARALIRKHYPDAPPKILDPFMGGGSTGLEALRLGAEAHGVELNPVAYLIQLCTLVYPQMYGQPKTVYAAPEPELEQTEIPGMEDGRSKQFDLNMPSSEPTVIQNPLAADVRKWGLWVLEEARKEIGHLYEDAAGRNIVGYLWARTAKCPNPQCGADIPLVRQWWLSKTDRKKVATRMIVDKPNKSYRFEVVEGDEIDFNPEEATMRQGGVLCPVCGQIPPEEYLREQGVAEKLNALPMVVIYEGDNNGGKAFRPFSEYDFKLFEAARQRLRELETENPDLLPDELITQEQPRIIWVTLYGFDQWYKLFSPRQLLALSTFGKKIQEAYALVLRENPDEEYAKAIKTYLALVFDRLANQLSTLSRWNNVRGTLEGVFARQAIPIVWDYIEGNPFSGATGAWGSALDWVVLAIKNLAQSNIYPASLNQGTATRIPIKDLSLEAVITDPPYYDAVPYSDLSDFFYVWLKRNVGDIYPDIFRTPLTPKSAEIVEQRAHSSLATRKDKVFYETELTKAFQESHRVLTANGIFVVVFAHKSTSAWETLISSLLSSGFVITASWPLNTEMASRMIAQGKGALSSSIFIVCRKRQANDDGFFDDVRREMTARIKERLDFFWSQGIRGADFFISAIGPAVEVFGRYRAVRKLSGEVVTVAVLLDLVQEAVADYTLSRVLNGRYKMGTVDAPTRFYVMYRWSYGGEKLLFDDARRLAQALGAEVSDLTRSGVLKQSGDSVTMPSATERKKDAKIAQHLGEAGHDGAVPSVIDVLHRAVLIWQEGDRRALAEYLAQHALGREEEVNAVAQALVNVLPSGDRERQFLENYLQGSSDLPDVSQQKRLL